MLGHKVLFSTKLNKENITTISKYKAAGAGPASKLRGGGISVILGSQVSQQLCYCKRDEVYLATLL